MLVCVGGRMTAVLTGVVRILVTWVGVGPSRAAGISFAVAFSVGVIALYRARQEPLAKEPAGVRQLSGGRLVAVRKLAGASRRELHDLGLVAKKGHIAQNRHSVLGAGHIWMRGFVITSRRWRAVCGGAG